MVFYADRNYLFEDIQKELAKIKQKYYKSEITILVHYISKDGSTDVQTMTNEKPELYTKLFEFCGVYFDLDVNGIIITFTEV